MFPVYGFDRIPTELLSEIFLLIVTSYGFNQPTEFIPAVRLSHVSQRWKRCVGLDPRLWTCLKLRGCGLTSHEFLVGTSSCSKYSPTMLQRDISALGLFISRAQRLPLALLIEKGYAFGPSLEGTEYGIKYRNELVPVLMEYIRRCRRLELKAPFSSFPWEESAPTFTSALWSAQRLRVLNFSRGWVESLKLNASFYSRLESLTVSDTKHTLKFFGGLNADSLQHLDVSGDYLDWVEFLQIAGSLKYLEYLSVSIMSPTYATGLGSLVQNLPRVRFERLRDLSVKFAQAFHSENAPLRILGFIDATDLESLHTSLAFNQLYTGGAEQLSEFLRRTPQLSKLSLQDDISFTVEEHRVVFGSVPQLRKLSFQKCSIEGPNIGTLPLLSVLSEATNCATCTLTRKGHKIPRYCPQLEYLHIGSPPNVGWRDILGLLASRSGCGERSNSVPPPLKRQGTDEKRGSTCDHEAKPLRVSFASGPRPEEALQPEWTQCVVNGLIVCT